MSQPLLRSIARTSLPATDELRVNRTTLPSAGATYDSVGNATEIGTPFDGATREGAAGQIALLGKLRGHSRKSGARTRVRGGQTRDGWGGVRAVSTQDGGKKTG